MKRVFLFPAAFCILLAAACGDATTEKVSHDSTPAASADSQQNSGANTGMADTMSTNATLPGSATGGTDQ